MNQYTIYCTEEQTKKALELGAPIERTYANPSASFTYRYPKRFWMSTDDSKLDVGYVIGIPTAEQMSRWLRENGLFIETMMNDINAHRYFGAIVFINTINETLYCQKPKETFEEATLAAIDAALDYLSKK